MGFMLNECKTHFITNSSKQIVTGVVVNEKVSVNIDYKRKLRQELYYVLKYGIPNVVIRQRMRQYINSSNPRMGYVGYYKNLMGRLDYVLSIEQDNDYFIKARIELKKQKLMEGINDEVLYF